MKLLLYLECLSFLSLPQELAASETWPNLKSYTFTATPSSSYDASLLEPPNLDVTMIKSPTFSLTWTGDSKTVKGCTSTTQCGLEEGGTVDDQDIFEDFAVYAARDNLSGSCWGPPNYCSADYLIQKGKVKDDNNGECTAYKISPPASPAQQFVASKTKLLLKFPQVASYSLLKYTPGESDSSGGFSVDMKFEPTQADQFEMTEIVVSDLTDPVIYCLVESDHSFTKPITKTLDGCSTTQCDLETDPTKFSYNDVLGNLGVFAARQYGTEGCSGGVKYCSRQYLVESGEIKDDQGNKCSAYKVHPANVPASDIIVSHTHLMFKFSDPGSYSVLKYVPAEADKSSFVQVEEVLEPTIADQFEMTTIKISTLTDPVIYCVVESSHTFATPVIKTVHGCSTTQCGLEEDPSDVAPIDMFGNLGVYAGRLNDSSDGNCWGDKRYCNSDYLIEKGIVKDDKNNMCSAYKIHPALQPATDFTVSPTKLMVKFDDPMVHFLLKYTDATDDSPGFFSVVDKIEPATAAQYKMTEVKISTLTEPTIFCIVAEGHEFTDPANSYVNGCATSQCDLEDDPTDVKYVDRLGDLAVYADKKDSCDLNPNHCSSEYFIEKGEIKDDVTKNKFAAYKVHPPLSPATQWVISSTKLMFKFSAPLATEYVVFRYYPRLTNDGKDRLMIEDYISTTTYDQYVMTEVSIDTLREPAYFFVVSNDDKLPSIWPDAPEGTQTQKATVFVDNEAKLALYAQLVDIKPRSPYDLSFVGDAPDTYGHKYSYRKIFYPVKKNKDGDDGVVWQDKNDQKIYVTWFLAEGGTETLLLQDNTEVLMAAVGDGGENGDIIFLTMPTGNAGDKVTTQPVHGHKWLSKDMSFIQKSFDTSKEKLNVYSYFVTGSSLAWNVDIGEVAWVFPRTMTVSESDGLNHQGCTIPILDPETLDEIRKFGGSSHSFANFVTNTKDGFLAVDLGDNYPRGVNTHKITGTTKKNALVYEFKTQHATNDGGGTMEVYEEISTPEKTYYKWSNDNSVYTEIAHPAGLVLSDESLMFIFAGEKPSLDNSMVGSNLNTPRNLGLVITDGNLEKVLSEGVTSEGGFYDFGGGWKEQYNEGIVWITDFTPNTKEKENWESATRIKTALLSDDRVFILYEVWYPTHYARTDYLIIDESGAVILGPKTVPYQLRLSPTDELVSDDGQILFYGNDVELPKLIRYHFEEITPETGCVSLGKKECKKEKDCDWKNKTCIEKKPDPCADKEKKKCKKGDGCKYNKKKEKCLPVKCSSLGKKKKCEKYGCTWKKSECK